MKIISITLLLILSQKVSYSESFNRTLPKNCGNNEFCKTPSTHCNIELGVCQCSFEYPIPVPRIGYCLDYRRLGEKCVIDEQCRQKPNRICFGSKQIDSITERDVTVYFRRRKVHIYDENLSINFCQCSLRHQQDILNDKCKIWKYNYDEKKGDHRFFLIAILVFLFLGLGILISKIFYNSNQNKIISERNSGQTPIDNESVHSDHINEESHLIQSNERLNRTFVNLHLSTDANLRDEENEPPPYPDDLPTYDEALDMSAFRK